MKSLASLLPDIVDLAVAAGERILPYYRQADLDVSAKADDSPVTRADLEADRAIVEGLRALDPATPCISEEGGLPAYEARKAWRRFWLVDPLDGTKEFVKKLGDFTVNIALIEGSTPALGVVYAPAKGCLYYAAAGLGAWKREGGGEAKRVYAKAAGRDGVVVVESRSHPSPELERFLSGINVKRRVKIGSSLKFCLVAEGAADLYPRFGPTMEWDTAAGDCVYRDSGRNGRLPSPLTYNKPSLKNGDFVIGAA